MSYTVTHIHAREVLDSRGNPTVEVELTLNNSFHGRAMVPSGASTGTHEALELRDGDMHRYGGKGVLKAVEHVNTRIKETVLNQSYQTVAQLEQTLLSLDGTSNKANLGANAILPCGMAWLVAVSQAEHKPLRSVIAAGWPVSLPIPYVNVLNGGAHADNGLDFQEFMIVPQGFTSFREAIRAAAEVFHTLKKLLKAQWLNTAVGDEWGYAPNIASNRQALDLLVTAITTAGYTTDQIKLALDVASSEFYKDWHYHISGEQKTLSSKELADYYLWLLKDYPIVSIEDGFAEDDFAWRAYAQDRFAQQGYGHIRTVGDDLYVTNPLRLQQGIDQHLSNAILIKLNQIGTVYETMQTIKLAQSHGMATIISHRSGETEDSFIADFVVAMNAGYIKTGSLSRSERVAKYNQLLRIEEELGDKASFGRV